MDTKNKNGKGANNSNTAHQNPSNGKAVEGKDANPVLNDKPGLQPKAEEPKTEPQKVVLSVEDKIRKVELLTDSIEKRSLLKNHLAKVEGLKFGEFDEKDSLTINSQMGGSYLIKSSSLVKEIAALVKTRIEEQIVIVEEQIQL